MNLRKQIPNHFKPKRLVAIAHNIELKRVNVNMPKNTYLAFKAKTSENDISISNLIRCWVDEYVARN